MNSKVTLQPSLALFVVLLATGCHAETRSECLLRSLKGVQSDAAARMIAKACSDAETAQRKRRAAETFGDLLDSSNFSLLTNALRVAPDGSWEVEFKNKSSKYVVRYVVLSVKDAPPAEPSAARSDGKPLTLGEAIELVDVTPPSSYYYRLLIKPGDSSWLKFPSPGDGKTVVLQTVAVRGGEATMLERIEGTDAAAEGASKDPLAEGN